MSAPRLLITGSEGMLGISLKETLSASYKTFHIDREIEHDTSNENYRCELTNTKDFINIVNHVNPNIIIHNAAMVDLMRCEKNKSETYALHCSVIGSLLSVLKNSCKLVYISTDSVFDGTKGFYNEKDIPNPLNFYSRTKFIGEQLTLSHPSSIVIRTNIYGFHKDNNKRSLTEWAISSLQQNRAIPGYNDVIFNAIYTKQLAEAINIILKKNYSGIIHIAGDYKISKYDFLIEVAKVFGLDLSLITSCCSPDMVDGIVRPKNTTLDAKQYKEISGKIIQLKDGLNWLYKDYINKRNNL